MSLLEPFPPRPRGRSGCKVALKPPPSEFVRGAAMIAAVLGETRAAVYHRLERGLIPGARKEGGTWVLHLPSYRASFAK